jgi:hypothetical protein
MAILKHNYSTDHIYMAWPDFLRKLEEVFGHKSEERDDDHEHDHDPGAGRSPGEP